MTVENKCFLKWPLIITAVIVVLRVVVELAGAPYTMASVFNVAQLHIIAPFYFGLAIATTVGTGRFKVLFRNVFLYSVSTRLMVAATYSLAYAFQWTAPRFSTAAVGVVGEGVTPFNGYIWIPIKYAGIWTLMGIVIGMIIGGIILLTHSPKKEIAV